MRRNLLHLLRLMIAVGWMVYLLFALVGALRAYDTGEIMVVAVLTGGGVAVGVFALIIAHTCLED